MSDFGQFILVSLGVLAGIAILVFVFRFVLWPVVKGLGWVVNATMCFIGRELRDAFRVVGVVLTIIFTVPVLLATLVMGRWSATAHFGNTIKGEIRLLGLSLYRLAIGNLLHSFGMGDVVAGLEQRIPRALADAPGADQPGREGDGGFIFKADIGIGSKDGKRLGNQFDGYKIVGSLPGGGSGGKLYIAEPDPIKTAVFERNGHLGVGQVVIKSFSTREGSSLPQIVRESRALDAAKRLGLVLDHELKGERFYYVMRYVPGQSLTAAAHQLHAESAPPGVERGLDNQTLRRALGMVADLLTTLDTYHRGGLWHKDVKPDNIIVDGHRAHLVDFGLVTPLRSAMTLTTHGTEYFRDPEMVRMALRGMKVAEVDGTRFDIYGAGAVLYSVIENQFPAHGVLSQITQRCPEAVRWIIRRAMTDYDKRYASAGAMLRDLESVRLASDPMAVKAGMLPSMREGDGTTISEPEYDPVIEQVRREPASVAAAAAAAAPPPLPPPLPRTIPESARGPAVIRDWSPLPGSGIGAGAGLGAGVGAGTPPVKPPRSGVRVVNWWTGEYVPEGDWASGQNAAAAFEGGIPRGKGPAAGRRSAAEQLASARARVEAARDRVRARFASNGPVNRSYSNNPNAGVYIGVAAALVLLVAVFSSIFVARQSTVVASGGDASEPFSTRDMIPAPTETPENVASDRGRVLVVVSLKTPIADGDRNKIEGAVASLKKAGFAVRGNYPSATGDEAATDDVAAVLGLAASAPLDLPEGRGSVAAWAASSEAGSDSTRADVVLFVRAQAVQGGTKNEARGAFVVLAAEAPNPTSDERARLTRLTLAASRIASR